MIANSRPLLPRLFAAPRIGIGARIWLAGVVTLSTAVRIVVATAHTAPTYFPDEYIYGALGRSIATDGLPGVRGGPAHFPALLEPLLAAPLWLVASTETAYHLVQAENAFFWSLAAVPAFLLARRLNLGTGFALGSAVFAVSVPDRAYSGFVLADPLGYPLALMAVYLGVRALAEPQRRLQAAFLAVAALATFARVQYVVLVPAFVAGALLLDRRRALRLHRLPLSLAAAGVAGVLAVGFGRVTGYYHSALTTSHVGGELLKWLGLELFFLALAAGVVMVPAAVAGLFGTRDRTGHAFVAFVVPFVLVTLFEGALYASNNPLPRFRERYLMVLLPLIPPAFGLYLRNGRPLRLPVTALAATIAGFAALLPLSGYAGGAGYEDSPLLWSFNAARMQYGVAGASLAFAAYTSCGAALAAAVGWGKLRRLALPLSIAAVVALSVGAAHFDRINSSHVRKNLVAPNPSWIDSARVGAVTALQTAQAPSASLIQQLFWNRSVTREVLLGPGAQPTDTFAAERVEISRNGRLRVSGAPIRTAILYQSYEATAAFEHVTPIRRFGTFTLFRPRGIPQLRSLEVGRYGDGWLAIGGTLEVWPSGTSGSTVSFTLSLPRSSSGPVTLRFGSHVYRLVPGAKVAVRLAVAGSAPWSATFDALRGASVASGNRPVSVRSTAPVLTPR